jgi:tRNA(Ile2) C34 agmatinyltransferase TiaS
MICPKCEAMMDSMGYGDEMCPVCGHVEYTESRDEFNLRIYGRTFNDNEENTDNKDTDLPG